MLDLKMASAGDKSKGKGEEGSSNTRKGIPPSESEYVKTSRKGFGTDHFINSRDQESWETTHGEHYYGSNTKGSSGSKMSSGQRKNTEGGVNGSNNIGTVYSRDGEIRKGSNSRSRGDEGKQLNSDSIDESIDKNNKLKMMMNTGDTRSSHVSYRNDSYFKETEDQEIEEQGEDEEVIKEEEKGENKREQEEDDDCGTEGEDVVEDVDIDSSEKKENYEKMEYAQGCNKDGFKDLYNKEKGEYKKNAFHNKEHDGSNCRSACDNSYLSDKEDDGIKKMEIIINQKEEQDQEENEDVEEYEEDFCEEKAEEMRNETKSIYLKNENEDEIKKESNFINGDHFSNSNEPSSKNYVSETSYVKEDMEETEKKKKLNLITNLLHLKNDDGLANHIRSILGEDNKYIGDNKNSSIHGCNNTSLMNSNNNNNDKKCNEHFNIVKNESNSEHGNNCGKHIITKDNWMNMKTLCLNYIRILKRLTNVWSETDKAFEYHFANLLNNESVNILENYLCCFSNIKIHAVKGIFMDSIIECIEELEILKKLKIPESKIEGTCCDNRDQNDIHKMSKVEFQKKVIEELDSNMSKEIIEEIHHLTMKNPYCNNYNMSNAYVSECDNNMQSMYSGMNKHNFFIEQEERLNKQKYKDADNNANETTLTKFFQAYPNLLNIFDDKSLSEVYNESELKELRKKCAKKSMDKYDISGCKEVDNYSTSYKMNDEDTCEDRDKLSKIDLDSRLLNTSDIAAAGNSSSFLNNTNNNIYHNTIGNTIISSSSSSKNNSSNNSPSINNALMNTNLSCISNNFQKLLKKRKIQETNMVKNSNGGAVNPSAYDLNYLLFCHPTLLKKIKMGLLEKNMLNTGSFNSSTSLNSTGNNSSNSNLTNNNNSTNNNNMNNNSSNNNNNNNNVNGGSLCMNGDDFRNKNYSFDYSGSDNGGLNSKKALFYRQSLLNSLKNFKGTYDQNQDSMSRRNSFSKLGETISPHMLFDLILNNANNANKGLNNMSCESMLGFGNNTSNISSYGSGNFSVLNGTKHGMNLNCNMSGGSLKKPYEMISELSAHLLNGQKPEYSPNIHDLSDLSKNQNNNAAGSNDSSNMWHIKSTKGEMKKNTKNSKIGLGISNTGGNNMRHSRSNSSNSGNSIRSNKVETKVGGKSARSGNNPISGAINTSGISVGVSHNSNLNTGAITGPHVTSSNVGTGVVVGKLKYEMPEGVNPNDDKVKGVYFSKSPRGVGKWNAYFQIANNKRLFTSFSVSKYGYNEARKLSILKRTQWEKEYNYQGDVKSGDTGRRGKKKTHGNRNNQKYEGYQEQ